MSNERIMLVEDEQDLARIIRDFLVREGYRVELQDNGKTALERFPELSPDLVILDVMLPGLDGMEVCRQIRAKSDIPVLILSAKSTEIDKILGLGLGADDYMTKPFGSGELLARVKALLRRYSASSTAKAPSANLKRFGELEIDEEAYLVLKNGRDAGLVAKEFELLRFLMQNPNKVFSRDQLFDQIWGFDEYGDISTVTVHIRKIREKIETDPSKPKFIKTVWGVGYKFEWKERA